MTKGSNVAQTMRRELCDALLTVGPDAPTLCEGWTTRDLATHLIVRETRPDAALGIDLVEIGEQRLADRAVGGGRPGVRDDVAEQDLPIARARTIPGTHARANGGH